MNNILEDEFKSQEAYQRLLTQQEAELHRKYEDYLLNCNKFERYPIGQDSVGLTVYEDRYVESSSPMSFNSFIRDFDNEFTKELKKNREKNTLKDTEDNLTPKESPQNFDSTTSSASEVGLLKKGVTGLREKFFGKSESNENKPK